MDRMIVIVVEDLFFLAKIQQTAKVLGVNVEISGPGVLIERLAGRPASGIVLDLNHRSGTALETVRKLKADSSTCGIPVIGFLSHVQTDLAREAREAGCDKVMARSGFAQELPQILSGLCAAGTS